MGQENDSTIYKKVIVTRCIVKSEDHLDFEIGYGGFYHSFQVV
jgi:hypothetical protein